jgi:hypothetical protein
MLHIFTIEYRGNAPTLPVDVCGAECDESQVPTLFFLLEKIALKKLKRKTGNALPVFLYNCAIRNQRAILPTAIARRCPSKK